MANVVKAASFKKFEDADQEVRALSFILSTLESEKVISFDGPVKRHRPEGAQPLQQISKILVRKKLDNVAIGVVAKAEEHCTIALDADVFQLSGATNAEKESKK
jgi:hypothetical protein